MNIFIYAEGGVEEWGPHTLDKGMGGSESAVVYMGKELTSLGHEVTVYNSVPSTLVTKEYGIYHPVTDIKNLKECDVLIVWRSPERLLDTLSHIEATKKYLWLHDVVPEKEVLPYIWLYDQIMVLSGFHREFYPSIPEEKIWYTRNGINLQDVETVNRNIFQLIYASDYDRGLLVLLENWTRLKLKFPKLTLKVAYGWNTKDKMAAFAGDKAVVELGVFKEYMENLFDQEGVEHLGRISKEELALEMSRSQILAYPCTFPEVSCITAMEAQAYGAVPVAIGQAALPETIKHGFLTEGEKVKQEDYLELLEHALSHPKEVEQKRLNGMGYARKSLTWSSLAQEWLEEFSRDTIEV